MLYFLHTLLFMLKRYAICVCDPLLSLFLMLCVLLCRWQPEKRNWTHASIAWQQAMQRCGR